MSIVTAEGITLINPPANQPAGSINNWQAVVRISVRRLAR